jgi:hypothetical protein
MPTSGEQRKINNFLIFFPVSPSMTTNQIKPIQSPRMCFYVEGKTKLNIELNKTRFNFWGAFFASPINIQQPNAQFGPR